MIAMVKGFNECIVLSLPAMECNHDCFIVLILTMTYVVIMPLVITVFYKILRTSNEEGSFSHLRWIHNSQKGIARNLDRISDTNSFRGNEAEELPWQFSCGGSCIVCDEELDAVSCQILRLVDGNAR
ncbi:uncharacterized protein BDR25DRAFT_349208 [Lindgomyces ingoldianus]|uniref:Uncharacterized protein n=1 Tax=Lindgomyces ingoldianus TaxID=673940 RepID=A0ACB6RES8_9PLEO|nr:uncharacterized protein BDR25DRAFT_349208 [Lindgomyces ingoldianus]KAF2477263.1 hypothetical protein BDR25DRAFT_349208 [Lindgomyces ingoldianus]